MGHKVGKNVQSFWKNKRVFVTGATGLVGFWLTKQLIEMGAHVIAFVRDMNPQRPFFYTGLYKKTTIVSGKLESLEDLERGIVTHEADTLFHLGAQAIVEVGRQCPLSTFEANIRGTYHLLEVCRQHKELVQRIVVVSSDKAYGTSPHLPYTEKLSPAGKYPYDVSKSCCDLIAQSYFHTYGLPLAVARAGNIFGGGDLHFNRLIPGTIRSFFHREAPLLRSDGSPLRDYLFVSDVVKGYLLLAEKLNSPEVMGEPFNFGMNRPLSVKEVVSLVAKVMGCEELKPVVLNVAKGEIIDQYLSSDKARKLLGWEPSYTFEKALEETIVWYAAYFQKVPQPLESYAFA